MNHDNMWVCLFHEAGLSLFLIYLIIIEVLANCTFEGKGRRLTSEVLAGRPAMPSLVARTAHISRSWHGALDGIWRSVGGSLSSSVLQLRSYSDEGLDGRALPCPEASLTAHVLGEFPPVVSTTQSFRAYRPVYGRNAYPVRKSEGYKIKIPGTVLEYPRTRAAFNEANSPVSNHDHASRNVAEESIRHSPRQGFVCDTELLPFGSPCGAGNIYLASATYTSRALKNRQQQGLSTNSSALIDALKRCSEQKDLIAARQLHDWIIQSGMDKHPYVATTLLNVYIKCGRLQDARQVFDGLQKTDRNVITWNVVIGAYAKSGCGVEAYRLFLQMKGEGFIPNAITFLSILNASASAGALEWVKEVHGHARKAGLESDLRVGNALVHMYAKSGSIDDARLVFDRMEKRDVITWNTMIRAYAESGCGMQAYRLFLQMKREGFIPDTFTFASILNPSASTGALEWVKDVHSHALKAGLESNVRVGTALIHMYAKSGSIGDARLIFDRLKTADVITWNIMIGAYAESGCGAEAYRLFVQMKREGFMANAFTFASILNAAASAGALEWVKDVHSHVLKAGLESDLRVGNALVHMYAKSGSIDNARLVFDRMENRDVITWTSMIGAYAESGCGVEAYRLFVQMKREGFIPDAFTYASILNATASAGALEWVKEVHSHALKAGLESDSRVGNALVHMYAKSGSIDDARLVFDRMEKRDVITWNVMISGLAQHGRGHEALKLFKKMNADCVNGPTLVAVLSACSHAGLVDDGRRLFLDMKQNYGVEATVVHYTCMVDVLGRAGHLQEAKILIDNMSVEPDAVTWKALLGACRTHCNVELGELAAKEVFKLEPKDSAAYVLLSNIYAATGRWEKVVSVRNMMQKRGVRKEPGRSWIEVDNKIHEFVVGDTSHPEATAIYSVLQELTEKLKAKGYIPDTTLVLHNINDEDKELALCSHSEKLAIAYGLLRVPAGKPIRVEKNLRICSDCHAATELISEVTGREIIAKDANRFHHFRDGVCSCGGYW